MSASTRRSSTPGGLPLSRAGLLLALLLTLATARLAAQGSPHYEEGVFDLQLQRWSPLTEVVLVDTATRVFVPLQAIAAAAGVSVHPLGRDSVLVLDEPAAGGDVRLDLRTGAVLRAGARITLPGELLIRHLGRDFVRLDALEALLAARVEVSWSELVVRVGREVPFPVEVQRDREARMARADSLLTAAHKPRFDPWSVRYPARNGGAVVRWWTMGSMPAASVAARVEVGSAVAGGDLTLGAAGVTGEAGGAVDWIWNYRRVWAESSLLRQLHVGELLSGGAVLRSYRGVRITNEPLNRNSLFADVSVAPDLPAGWWYEVYQDGRLVGHGDRETAPTTWIPLRYGSTPVEVRMYGPDGSSVVRTLQYEVPVVQLAPGRLEYEAGGGVCPDAGCRGLAYGRLAYGASRLLTLSGGAELERDSSEWRSRPFATLQASHWTGWFAQASMMRWSFARATLGYGGRRRTTGQMSAGLNHPGSGRPTFLAGVGARWFGRGSLQWRPTDPRVAVVTTEANAEGPAAGGIDRWRASAGLTAGRHTWQLAYGRGDNPVEEAGVATASYSTGFPPSAHRLLRNRFIHLGAGFAGARPSLAEAGMSTPLPGWGQLQVGAEWARGGSSPRLSVDFTRVTGFAQSRARVVAVPSGRSAMVSSEGTLVLEPGHGAVPVALGGLGTAGVSGRVFLDHDRNGSFGPGDEPALDVPVLIDGQRATSDSAGIFRAWNVRPYDPVRVSVDTLRTSDPSWVPLRQGEWIRLTPHMMNEVAIPLVRTVELIGKVVAERGVSTAGGITLELRRLADQGTLELKTFSNGEYYDSRLRPGTYTARIAASSLEALQARAAPDSLVFEVDDSSDEFSVELPPIHLHPQVAPAPTEAAWKVATAEPVPAKDAEPELPLLGRAYFDFDRSELRPEALAVLDEVVGHMRANPRLRVEVQGHTDSRGAAAYNLRLSAERARAVAEYLIQRGGDRARITTRGYGEERPLAPNDTEAGRDRNRRVEFRQSLDPADPPAPAEVPR